MFCPKCGSQNADETKFCRGCGADVSNVLAATPAFGRPSSGRRGTASSDTRSLAEKAISLNSRGIRGLMMGFGFLIISLLSFLFRNPASAMWLIMLIPAFLLLSTGVSRLFQAKRIKELDMKNEPAALPTGQADYITPPRSFYDTDGMIGRPASVTEHTTTHLELDTEPLAMPKK